MSALSFCLRDSAYALHLRHSFKRFSRVPPHSVSRPDSEYFNGIEGAPGVHANGAFTLGENIADNGGLNVSFDALQRAKAEGGIAEVMDGFTAEQRFFLAYAAVWANNITEAEIARRVKTDPHSLGKWRVNGTLPHVDAFVKAFNIKEGDKMYIAPENRAKIW